MEDQGQAMIALSFILCLKMAALEVQGYKKKFVEKWNEKVILVHAFLKFMLTWSSTKIPGNAHYEKSTH